MNLYFKYILATLCLCTLLGCAHKSQNINTNSIFTSKGHNGLYHKHTGQLEIVAELAISGRSSKLLYVVIPKEQVKLFPFKAANADNSPQLIQLVYAEKVIDIEKIKSSKTDPEKDYIVIGKAKVEFRDFNIGGDCGTPSYFSFQYKLTEYSENLENYFIAGKGC